MCGQLRCAGQTIGIDAAGERPLLRGRLPQQILTIEKDGRRPESKTRVVRGKCAEIHIHKDVLTSDDGKGLPEDPVAGAGLTTASGHLIGATPGLGLPVSAALAEAAGGSLDHVRAFGWTNILVTLPLAPDRRVAESKTQAAASDGELPVLTVVIDELAGTHGSAPAIPSPTKRGIEV